MDDLKWNAIVVRLTKTSLKNLDKDEFDNLLYQAHIDGRSDVLTKALTSKKKRNRYLRLLDTCYVNGKTGALNQMEHNLLQKVPLETLPDLIVTEAQKYGVNIDNCNFRMHRIKLLDELKQMFEKADRSTFEQFVIEKLKREDGVYQYKVAFINLLEDDPVYAYCWTKFIKLRRKVPVFVRELKNTYKADAKMFIRRMNGEEPSVDASKLDMIESCKIFDRPYKLITVATKTAMQDFLHKYFVASKPKVLGLDVESIPIINQVALIQLATSDWCCIIDVCLLSKQLSQIDWMYFFGHVFNPEITRVGFAFASDCYFIGNTFPYISPLMQDEKRKGLCLKKLVENILKDQQTEHVIFGKGKPATVSLVNVTKIILGIYLDKELQRSDWSERPLSKDQKIYAVTDAVVVLLIKEKIENELKKKLGSNAALKIMEDGYVSMKSEKDEAIESLTKSIGGVKI